MATVLGDLSAGRATSKADAAAHPGADQAAIDAARERIIAVVAPEHRQRVREWLSHPDCHAVEIHGPQVSDRELELRAGWTRPPDHGTDGADKWRVRDHDHKVVSKHRAGAEATRFASPQAFAHPLDVLLTHADQYPGGLDAFLDDHSDDGAVAFHLSATSAGLGAGDTFGHRGAGTGTPEAAKDWVQVRADAMRKADECTPPVRTLAFDPIDDGPDPGIRLVFRERPEGWGLTTYYPSAVPAPDNVRLEFPA